MEYAVVIVPAAPVRRKPWHQSEMTSQLLFGETVKLLKQKGNLWVKVRSLHDDYEGWMTNTLLQEIKEDDAKAYSDYVSTGFLNVIHLNESKIRIPMGASLPGFMDGRGKINGSIFQLEGEYHKRSEQRLEAGTVNASYFTMVECTLFVGRKNDFGC